MSSRRGKHLLSKAFLRPQPHRIVEWLLEIVGHDLDPKDLGIVQLVNRLLVVFAGMLVMIRLADRRFLARRNAFDVLLAFLIGSMLARAINGSGPLFKTLFLGFILVLLHRLINKCAYHSSAVSWLLKGRAYQLVRAGKPVQEELRRHHVTDNDLEEDLRLEAGTSNLEEVEEAWLERSGEVSVKKSRKRAD
jgi:uncharacterized membrane protein YcaP (DUF421 family)